MEINNVSIIRSALRKLFGWSSIYHPTGHRVRPGKCLNRTNIINIIMLTQAKARTDHFRGFPAWRIFDRKTPSEGEMVEYSTMHVSL